LLFLCKYVTIYIKYLQILNDTHSEQCYSLRFPFGILYVVDFIISNIRQLRCFAFLQTRSLVLSFSRVPNFLLPLVRLFLTHSRPRSNITRAPMFQQWVCHLHFQKYIVFSAIIRRSSLSCCSRSISCTRGRKVRNGSGD